MICITVALSWEAQPLIEYYNLSSIESPHFRIYGNEQMRLIISGVGKLRSAIATTYILSHIEDIDNCAAVNVGLCGAYDQDYAVGTPILINKVKDMDTGYEYFPDILFSHDTVEGALETHRKVVSRGDNFKLHEQLEGQFVDMEAAGFFEAASVFLPPHRISCIKVVSDHLGGTRLNREDIAKMIGRSISHIDNVCTYMRWDIENVAQVLDDEDRDYLEDIANHLRLTTAQTYELFDMAFKYKLRTRRELPMFDYVDIHVESKREGKRELERIRQKFWSQ